jgi:hypothetical protein
MVTVGHYVGMKELRSEAYKHGFWCRSIIETGPLPKIPVRHDYVPHLKEAIILLIPRLLRNVALQFVHIPVDTQN